MQASAPADNASQGCELLDRAIVIWRKAQVLHQAPSWKGEPEARAVAEQIAADRPECEPVLASLLLDKSQLVAAYALLTLELMRSSVLQSLPSEVLQRRANVTLITGSVKTTIDLGGLARQVQKRAKEWASDPLTSPVS
jgi:hypothetical protein